MARKIASGIDVGTHQIKVVIAEQRNDGERATVLGTGYALSRGIRHGYVINKDDLVRTLQSAVTQAEKAAGIPIRHTYLSVGGVGLEEYRSRAEVVVSRADNEVSDLDIKHALEESERKISSRLVNRRVIHTIPLAFRLDGERLIGRAVGMKGSKLEVDTLFISALEQHLQDLIGAVEEVGISVTDVMASPLAGSFVTLTKAQKIAGVVLANIGAETVSIAVFENDIPISVKVFPVGSTDVTHDIALGLRISLDDAEQAKRGALVDTAPSKKQLDDIISSRMTDMFLLVDAHLKRLGKNGLLPAGIVISGGGSGVTTVEDIARAALKLPSKRATLNVPDNAKIKDSSWAVAYGLCLWGIDTEKQSSAFNAVRERATGFMSWFKQFLP